MSRKNKMNKSKYKKKKTIKSIIQSIIKPWIIIFIITIILVCILFISNPKDGWISFNGRFSMMKLSGNVIGSLTARVNSLNIPNGKIGNCYPIILEYDNKSIELREEEFSIEFKDINDLNDKTFKFTNDVFLHSRNSFITKELIIDSEKSSIGEKLIKINGGNIYGGIKDTLDNKYDESLEGITWELSGKYIEIATQKFSRNYDILVKGKKIELENIETDTIKIKSAFENAGIRLYIKTNKPIDFYIKDKQDLNYSGRADKIIFSSSSTASLNFINSPTPQVLQIPLTTVTINRIRFEDKYHNQDEYVNNMKNIENRINEDFTLKIAEVSIDTKEKNETDLNCMISGRVNDVILSGKSLFPNFTQWISYNSNNMIIIVLTGLLTAVFTLISKKSND